MEPIMMLADSGSSSGTLAQVASDIFSIATNALNMITGNSLLLTFFGAGIVGIAIGAIRKLKHS